MNRIFFFTIHTPGDLSSLLVTPTNGSKVGLVVHEAAVEERCLVWVWRADVDLSTTGWIFL